MCHCERGCAGCRGLPCSCEARALAREPSGALAAPGFHRCETCGHAVTDGMACLACQVIAERGCGCGCRDQDPGSTPEAVRMLLARLGGRYADAD
jgi:hypothetical protein